MKYSAILLIATRQIGDVLLITPLLRSLRRAYPDAVIDVLVYENNGGMLEGNPDYNTLISVAEHPNFGEYKILFKQIFHRYDLAISTLSGDRPLIYALFAAHKRVAVVPPKRWQDAWKRLFVQAWTELDNQNTHTVIQNLRLADLLGIERCYEFVIPQPLDNFDKLDQVLPFAWQKEPFAVLHLLPMWHYKRWTLRGWEQLVHYLIKVGLRVVLTGGDSQEEIAYLRKALSKLPNTVINLAGQLRFCDVAQLIRASTIYIGPDTAVTHLAAATGVPTVALYGPTNPLKWAPWPFGYAENKTPFKQRVRQNESQKVGNVFIVQGKCACVPCHQEGCERHKQSYSRCLEELESASVIEAVKVFLK
ncbi:MAG: glycosyltransferase family 9 protein [Thiomargarita sp.]|nr:glycosyltransferase family 9 protein [Thiomargarita sp.]